MSARVALLLGRAPSSGSVVHGVRAALESAGAQVHLDVVDGRLPVRASGADLLVHKDLRPEVLAAIGDGPAVTCNDAPAELRTLDKAAVVEVLREAGLPVPSGHVCDDWSQVRAAASVGPVVVKPRTGTQGQGVLLLDGPAPAAPVTAGPWLVQDRLRSDGVDRKLYVVGEHVDGTLRRFPDRTAARPFQPGPELSALGRAAARALGLEVCGVDVVLSPSGPVVVDVNAFPGFKQVPGAGARIASHLLARLHEEVAVCA